MSNLLCSTYFFDLSGQEISALPDGSPSCTAGPEADVLESIAAVQYPSKPSHRYATLDGMAKILFDLAKHNKSTYQRTVVQLQSMINVAKAESDGVTLASLGLSPSSTPLAPPARESGRQKDRSTTNHANRSRKKRKKNKDDDPAKGKCTVCRGKGDVPDDNHRAGSKKCPYYQQPLQEAAPLSATSYSTRRATSTAINDVSMASMPPLPEVRPAAATADEPDAVGHDPSAWPQVQDVSNFAERRDVPGDGNCGLHSVREALAHKGCPIAHSSKPITAMRKAIYDEINANRIHYFGTGIADDDQNDHLKVTCAVINNRAKRRPFWVEYSTSKGGAAGAYRGIFSKDELEQYLQEAILKHTWKDGLDFDSGCNGQYFMSLQKHLPVIAKLYKASIVCFTNPSQESELPNGATFACMYESTKDTVTIYDFKNIRKPPPDIPCIYKCNYQHYNWLRLKS